MRYASAILAGGKSSRMGENKALMKLGDKRVIEHIVKEMNKLNGEMLLVTNDKASFQFLDLPFAPDSYDNKGPLAGLEAALSHLPEGYVCLAACDTPFVSSDVYRYLLGKATGKQAVIPNYNERNHPLSGIYHSSILPEVRRCLESGDLKIQLLLDQIDYRIESNFEGFSETVLQKHFFNMNNRAEYEQALNFL